MSANDEYSYALLNEVNRNYLPFCENLFGIDVDQSVARAEIALSFGITHVQQYDLELFFTKERLKIPPELNRRFRDTNFKYAFIDKTAYTELDQIKLNGQSSKVAKATRYVVKNILSRAGCFKSKYC
jgi:hypothetical protein